MSETCETVKIQSETAPGGYVVINESDFDPDKHKLVEEPNTAQLEPDIEPARPKGRPKKAEE